MGALGDGYPSQARSGGGRRPAGAHWGSLLPRSGIEQRERRSRCKGGGGRLVHEENESMHDPRLYLLLAELLANFVNDIPGTFDGECSSRLERGLPAGEAQGRDRGGEHHP